MSGGRDGCGALRHAPPNPEERGRRRAQLADLGPASRTQLAGRASPGLILHTTVGIGYEAPWRQVEAMLNQAAARTPGILRDPEPFVPRNPSVTSG